jgi:hypothetical protein
MLTCTPIGLANRLGAHLPSHSATLRGLPLCGVGNSGAKECREDTENKDSKTSVSPWLELIIHASNYHSLLAIQGN